VHGRRVNEVCVGISGESVSGVVGGV